MLLLCKATITGDCQAIRSLLSEPASTDNSPWYMSDVHQLLSQGTVKMYCPIAVSIMVRNFDATRELLLCTDLDMRRKQVDWSRLKLTVLHPSWIYSIVPWVVNLKLGNNHLRKIPQEFLQAAQLRRLDLSSNLLEVITVDLFSLPNLEWLNLSQNKLKELPELINWSPSLINLDLSHNHLTTLPSSIQNSMLEILQLSHNKFTVVPKCLCRIRSLTTLDLSYMPITSLPREMDMLDKLANLNVTNSNINDFPTGTPPSGPRLVRAFVKSRARSNKPCNIMKLVVMCNSSVGKHVMFSRLRQITCPPGSHLPEMNFFQWSYRPFKFFGIQKVVFNTWMIGVQKDYRSLYPSIYTSNCLYVLVWDMTRTGDIREQIKMYVDGIARHFPRANILVTAILPDPFETWADTNTAQLSKRLTSLLNQPAYQSIQSHGLVFLPSNNTNPKEAPIDIRIKIYEAATQMTVNGSQVVGRQYPENYYNLIPVIEREHTNLKTSGRPGIMEESSLWSMFEAALGQDMPDSMELPVIMSFLQEVGYLMHFEDPNVRLDQYYFLHPEWVIATIHRILHSLHYHHAMKPLVTINKLFNLLKLGNNQKSIMVALVRLMVRFTILLPISDTTYLIPSLLPSNSRPLAMLQVGCYRRQFIPKGKALPEDFWFYMISHVLFHLPRLLTPNDMIYLNLLKASETKRRSSSVNSLELLDEEASSPASPSDHKVLGEPYVSSEVHSLSPYESDTLNPSTAEDAIELVQKPLDRDSGPHRRPRGSPTRSHHISNDPVELSRGIFVWRTGIHLITEQVQVAVYSQTSDLGLEESGIEVCASDGDEGRDIMARMCWLIQKLLEQRYPEFSPQIQASSQLGLTQIILCPMCMRDQGYCAGGGATNFISETCFVALKEKEAFSHNCHHHVDPIPLRDLIPEYVLVDLPSSLNLPAESFSYQESRIIYQDNNTLMCYGSFNGQPVTVKVYSFSETKSYTVPLSALRQEVDMLTHLNHPNIIRIFGFCLSPPAVLLERSPLGTLLEKLSDNELEISRLTRFHIARQVVSALAYLHKQGIIYRTLKTDSIFAWSLEFEDEISVKLAQLNRAAFTTPSGLLGRTDFSFYPAPEMVRYEFNEEYTEKVDIYSFGVLLYELVARWQPFACEKANIAHKPKLTGLVTYKFPTLVKLMEECWEEDMTQRPSALDLVHLISNPQFQCHLSTQILRDCVSVRGCCFVPSLRQVWAYGEYNVIRDNGVDGTEVLIEGTQIFILNATNLTVQGSLELKERANAISTVDSKVWVGMLEACIHVYDSTTFNFTDRIYVKDSVTHIATNDKYAFVGLANGTLTYYEKLQFPRVFDSLKVSSKAIIAMISVGECVWVCCGNEIIVLSADEEIAIAKRWEACKPNDQVYALVLSEKSKLVWSIIRGSLVLVSWDASSCEQTGLIDLSNLLIKICEQTNLEKTNLRLLCLECSQDVVWVGVSIGVIILLTATPQPEIITWFHAHRNASRCLMSIPDLNPDDIQVVLSGGFGEESYLKTRTSYENGVIMSWQSLSSSELKMLSSRATLS